MSLAVANAFIARIPDPSRAVLERWSSRLDLRGLQAEFGSNVWVVSAERLAQNLAAWARVAGSVDRIAYPVKANPSPAVLEILASLGARAECASRAEVELAKLAGFGLERIVFNSPSADARYAGRLLRDGATVVADSRETLAALDAFAAAAGGAVRGRLFIRVNPAIDIRYRRSESWSELTSHAKRTGKFGIPSEEVVDAVAALTAIEVTGLHAHAGTQMDHVAPFVALAEHLTALADEIAAATGHRVVTLDLGGGLGIPFSEADDFPSIEAFADAVRPSLSPRFDHWFEPGHALVGDAVALLATVTGLKSVRGRRWAIADVGTDQLAKITLLDWRHPVLGPDGRRLPTEGPDALGGPLCFSGDVLLPATDISGLEEGDPILVQPAGAYCASLSNTFNGRRSGGTAVIRADGSIVRTADAAGRLDEPLVRGHRWGSATGSRTASRSEIDVSRLAHLTSKVLREDCCAERFAYRSVAQVGERAWEFLCEVDSPVPFVAMPLATRIAGDAAIVSTLLMLGKSVKTFPIWGASLEMKITRQIPSGEPLKVRIELSHPTEPRAGGSRNLAVRFTLGDETATGAFEIHFDDAV
jgi:diaminopimelate decarboxylase